MPPAAPRRALAPSHKASPNVRRDLEQPKQTLTPAIVRAVKTGRPDVGELSRGQNQVRVVSETFMDNVTPT